VDQAELMTVRAQNRILKVVEEPPGHILILFITENKDAMLPTVLSRLQRLSFNRIPPTDMENWLIEKGYEAETSHLAALYADGSLGMAIKLLTSPDFHQMREAALHCLCALHEGDTLKAFERIDPYLADKVSTISFMDLMIIWYRDTLLLKYHPESPLRFTKEVTETFDSLSKFMDAQRVPLYIEIVEGAKKAIGANANHPLVAEAMLLKLTGGQL
jgi:DNA polymerase-3 subunit delta'